MSDWRTVLYVYQQKLICLEKKLIMKRNHAENLKILIEKMLFMLGRQICCVPIYHYKTINHTS